MLGSVAQLGELVRQLLSLAADLVERRPQGLPGFRNPDVMAIATFCASVSCWRIWGVVVTPELILDAAQVVRQRILSCGELVDHR